MKVLAIPIKNSVTVHINVTMMKVKIMKQIKLENWYRHESPSIWYRVIFYLAIRDFVIPRSEFNKQVLYRKYQV